MHYDKEDEQLDNGYCDCKIKAFRTYGKKNELNI